MHSLEIAFFSDLNAIDTQAAKPRHNVRLKLFNCAFHTCNLDALGKHPRMPSQKLQRTDTRAVGFGRQCLMLDLR